MQMNTVANSAQLLPEQVRNRPGRKSTASTDNIYYVLRVMNGLSMAELSRYLRCQPNTICQLEHNEGTKFKVIKAMSELFGVSMDDLVRNNVAAVVTAKGLVIPSITGSKHKTRMLTRVDRGDIGEELVADIERAKLAGTGYENRVSTRPAKNRRNGYDVISATADGQPKYIEVKTTVSSDPDEPFYMTDAEYRKMKEFFLAGSAYELYRVYDMKVEDDRDVQYKYIVYTPQEVLDLFEPLPETYRMMKKGGRNA